MKLLTIFFIEKKFNFLLIFLIIFLNFQSFLHLNVVFFNFK